MDRMETLRAVSGLLAAAWAVAALVAAADRRRATALWCAVLAVLHALAALDAALAPLVLAGWLVHALSVPSGRLGSPVRAAVAAAGAAGLGAWSGTLLVADASPRFGSLLGAVLAVALVGGAGAAVRWRDPGAPGRRTLRWLAAGVVLAVAVDVVLLALHLLVGAPRALEVPLLASLLLVPVAQALAVHPRTGRAADAALVQAVVLAGLAALVVAVYVVVVVGLGRPPVGGERDVMLLSLAAAVVVAALAFPVRQRLQHLASGLVGGRRPDAEEVVSTFGSRMSRAIPLDELLLQLAELLRATLAPAGAEIWVSADGVLRRAVAVPHRGAASMALDEHAQVVLGRARVGGRAWAAMWLPDLPGLRDAPDAPALPGPPGTAAVDGVPGATGPARGDLRVAPVAHLGQLLGLLVVRRAAGETFAEDDERQLVELARQLGLALHNVRLDSALQASLAELEQRNAELQASRLRIVTASDEARRSIERDLHDGAQQQLVALAVQLALAAQVAPEEPDAVPEVLEGLRAEVQATIRELRELAHGIYPPLLRDRGLGEALGAAANRSPLPCRVEVDLPGRYPLAVETALYFCCLEALQNAGKHAGDGATVTVRLRRDAGPDGGDGAERVRFEVADDGVGLDPGAAEGHGFVNMRDRLGALGGELTVAPGPGGGTVVRGSVPAAPLPAPEARPVG